MSTTRQFIMPNGSEIGTADKDGAVRLNDAFFKYVGGIEDVTGRVADTLDPATATVADVVNALIAAKLMKAS